MKAEAIAEKLGQIQSLIESGDVVTANVLISKISYRNLQREQKLLLANFCRRSGQPEKALIILRPTVRPAEKKRVDATDSELLEYAVSLTYLGAVKEAAALYSQVKNKSLAEYSLYPAFNHIKVWDYQLALPLLRDYVQKTEDLYKRSIGQINLIQGLLFCDKGEEAEAIFKGNNIESFLKKEGKSKLLSNYYELKAQYCFQVEDWKQANTWVEAASRLMKQNSSVEKLFVQKWKFLIDLYESENKRGKEHFMEPWLKLRAESVCAGHHETLRDLDFHFGLKFQNIDLLNYVFRGTPYESYKTKIQEKVSKSLKMQLTSLDPYVRPLFRDKLDPTFYKLKDQSPIVDPQAMFTSSGTKVATNLVTLFACLNEDFYKGASTYKIFETVYEGEFFNPTSSPLKIRQLMHRLREFLEQNQRHFKVGNNENIYELVPIAASCGIQCASTEGSTARQVDFIEQIATHFGTEAFKAGTLSEKANIPLRTVTSKLKDAVESGQISKIGAGPNTQYKKV